MHALLDPPPGPAAPGAYDFARDAWFEGMGGVGLAMRPPSSSRPWPRRPGALRLEMAVNAAPLALAPDVWPRDIDAVMGPDDGGAAGLAVAVTTSHQDWLAADHRNDLRGSGLAHMLAIAGLHTAALSGFVFFAFRFGDRRVALAGAARTGKKVAAAAAWSVVAGLSGAVRRASAGRRAAITASVAFLAILVDRRAVSLHSLALAALIILLIEPEVVVQPGFEMSFCATASLVALAEVWPRRGGPRGPRLAAGVLQQAPRLAARHVRWSASSPARRPGPFAIQHFNRVANYGVFANLTADFVASARPDAGAGASRCWPRRLGLGASLASPVLWLAGWAARAVIASAHLFAAAPGGGDRPFQRAADRAGDLLSRHRVRLPVARRAALDRPAAGGRGGALAEAGAAGRLDRRRRRRRGGRGRRARRSR